MKVTKQEKLDVSARDYVMQTFSHTKSKIIGELRRQGYAGIEIIKAIKKAKEDLGVAKKHKKCSRCNGTGNLEKVETTDDNVDYLTNCDHCGGSGRAFKFE